MTLEHDAVRDRLVSTALKLMEQGRLAAVKARTVAEEVGVSVGTVYNLFGNVDGLLVAANMRILADLNAVGRTGMAGLEQELEERIAKGETPDTGRERALFRLLGLCRVYIGFVAANSERWASLLAFNRSRPAAEADEAYVAQQDALIDIIGNALLTTPLAADNKRRRTASRALWSSVHGIVTMNYFGADQARAEERTWAQIELLVTAFVDGVCSPYETAATPQVDKAARQD